MNSEYPGTMNGQEEAETEAQIRALSVKLYGRDLLAYVGQLERLAWAAEMLLSGGLNFERHEFRTLLSAYNPLPRIDSYAWLDTITSRTCRTCGCSDEDRCEYERTPGIRWPCTWVEVDLCSRCKAGRPHWGEPEPTDNE